MFEIVWLSLVNQQLNEKIPNFFQINIDPESLKPKLPSRKNLKPYPTTCYLEYRGHKGAVLSISTEASGEWIASGNLTALFSSMKFTDYRRFYECGFTIYDVS